jgi:outer membrane autotransporter protein
MAMALTAALGSMTPLAAQAVGCSSWDASSSCTNTGTLHGLIGVAVTGSGPGLLTNSGTISGDVFGIYSNGVSIGGINNTIGGSISGGTYGIYNDEGANVGSIGNLSNSGSITGRTAILNDGTGTIGTLSNNGTITALGYGIENVGSIGSLSNSKTISSLSYGIYNTGGTIGTLSNSGTISGSDGIYNNGGTIGTLNNSGTISGNTFGIDNTGDTIGTLSNSGAIIGQDDGIYNSGGSIGTLNNSGTISAASGYGIVNVGSIGSLSNSGTISAATGISNNGTIGTLNNSGTISAASAGVLNRDYIGRLSNSGSISGNTYGILNWDGGTIATLSNSGTISGGTAGIFNNGTIGTINNSGLIVANIAINISTDGAIGTIINTGIISGNFYNAGSNDLLFEGGEGATYGTLTGDSNGMGIGSNNIGNIDETIPTTNVVFASGNQLLNDNISANNVTLGSLGAATLQVNNQLTITGNYSQAADATLEIGVSSSAIPNGVDGDTGYGRLYVTGAANIAAGATIDLHNLGGFTFQSGQKYMIVEGGSSSTYGTLVNNGTAGSGGLTLDVNEASGDGTFVDDSNDLIVSLSGGSRAAPVATLPNAINSLNGLNNAPSNNSQLYALSAMANTAAAQGTAAANQVGAQLAAGPNVVAAAQASIAQTSQVLNLVTDHSETIRLEEANGYSGVSAGESPTDWAVWGEGFGGQTSQGERDGVAGYNAHYNGLLIGADAPFGDNWRAGGLFSYGNTSVADTGDNSGSGTHVDAYGLLAYASYTGNPWYVDLTGGAVQQQYDTLRAIDFADDNATAQHHGMQYVASVEGGYPIYLGNLMPDTTLTPLAALNYSYLTQSGYTESNSNSSNQAGLTVSGTNDTSITSDLGAKLERAFTTEYGDLVPSVQLTWRHQYQNTRLQTNAVFAADTTGVTAFTTAGPTPITDSAVLTLGVTLLHSRNVTLSGQYQVNAANGYSAQTADVRVRYQF